MDKDCNHIVNFINILFGAVPGTISKQKIGIHILLSDQIKPKLR